MNALNSKPKLPFICIPSLNLKILIDSGASNSIINPEPAKKYFKNYFFQRYFTVKSLNQTVRDKNIRYPLLKEFGIKSPIEFHVLPWHDRFDALIGSHDFQRLGANIDYRNQTLRIGNCNIPFYKQF